MPGPLRASLLSCLGLLIGLPSALASDDLFLDSAPLPEILTATRLQQPPAAVPGSISVIDRQLIQASGARTLPDVLRLVPGMLVVPAVGNPPQTTVNYHGSSANQARRLQVLIDGRSVYRTAFAQVGWDDLPLAIEDIERIEVFRGPNTVSYGANALMAVVNVITRTPRDSHGTHFKITQGQNGINDWYARHGMGWEGGDLRLSLSGQQDDGFDRRADGAPLRDERRLSRFNLRMTHEPDSRHLIDWRLGVKEGSTQVNNTYSALLPLNLQPGEQDEAADITGRDYAADIRWRFEQSARHTVQVQANLQHWERLREWRACEAQPAFSAEARQLWSLFDTRQRDLLRRGILAPQTPEQWTLAGAFNNLLNASFDPLTGTFEHACGLINEDSRETRLSLELQDTLSLSDSLRLLSGASYRHDQASSQTYLGNTRSRTTWRLFGHLEWYLDEHWLLQGGSTYEYDSSIGASLTPRVALNYLISPAHGLRAVYSEAIRAPDMFENDARWHYTINDLRPRPYGQPRALFFITAEGPGTLDHERMRSYELGYNGQFARQGLSLDLKLFHDEITDMISGPLQIFNFNPNNQSRLRLSGVEGELDWRLGTADRLRLGYTYLDIKASHPDDRMLSPRHSGTIGWLRNWQDNWSTALFYHGADMLNQYRFEQLDVRLAKQLSVARSTLELAVMLQQRLDDEPLSRPNNNLDERRLLWFSAGLEF